MEVTKLAAVDEFFRAVQGIYIMYVRRKIFLLIARSCYDQSDEKLRSINAGDLVEIPLVDGCFLVQFMVSMRTKHPPGEENQDPLVSRAEVHTQMNAIARDVLLLENQIDPLGRAPSPHGSEAGRRRCARHQVPRSHRMASVFDTASSSSTGTKPSSSALLGPEPCHLT
jgi:hypothetical protein